MISAMTEGLTFQRILTPDLIPDPVIYAAFAALAVMLNRAPGRARVRTGSVLRIGDRPEIRRCPSDDRLRTSAPSRSAQGLRARVAMQVGKYRERPVFDAPRSVSSNMWVRTKPAWSWPPIWVCSVWLNSTV